MSIHMVVVDEIIYANISHHHLLFTYILLLNEPLMQDAKEDFIVYIALEHSLDFYPNQVIFHISTDKLLKLYYEEFHLHGSNLYLTPLLSPYSSLHQY